MKRLLFCISISLLCAVGQNQQSPSDRVILTVPVPQGPSQVVANPTKTTGANTRFYFVVAILPSGKSAAAGPAVVYQVPDTGTVVVNWTPVANATGYDVLRWITPVLPINSCSCSVSLNQAGTSFTDTLSNATGVYATSSLGAIGAGVETLNVTNTQFADIRAVSSLPLVVPKLCFTDTTCQTTAGGGGGGASSQAQLTDWQTTVGGAGTTLNNTSCSVTTPCDGRTNEHTYSPYTGQPYVATLTPGAANVNCGNAACNGNIYEYLDQTGVWTFLYGNGNMGAGSVVCGTGWTCTQQNVISEFPNGACGLYVWSVTANVIATTPTLDSHGVACSVPAIVAGTGISISGINPKTITNTSPGASSAGGNGTFQQSNGSGGFAASSCVDNFGVTTCGHAFQFQGGMGVSTHSGFGVQTCSTTYTLLGGGLEVVNLTGNCTLSISSGGGFDAAYLTVVLCEDATGGRTITWPANMVGVGTAVTTANKCNAQTFISSNVSATIGGHSYNANWFAVTPMISY